MRSKKHTRLLNPQALSDNPCGKMDDSRALRIRLHVVVAARNARGQEIDVANFTHGSQLALSDKL